MIFTGHLVFTMLKVEKISTFRRNMANFFIALHVYAMLAMRTSYVSDYNWNFEDMTDYDLTWAQCYYNAKLFVDF
jgi:hypothetical protein